MLRKSILPLLSEPARPGGLACAVVYSDQDVALLLQSREGRFPAMVTLISEPMIGWVCRDGEHEHVELKGPNGAADFRALAAQCEGGGLLVGEVGDLVDQDVDAAAFSLLCMADHDPNDAHGGASPAEPA